jgi:Cu+-exporting ATPase
MKEIKIVVFDKTGTITKGKPEVTDLYSKVKESYLLEMAGSIEKLSEHPIAHAIVTKANLKKYRKVTGFKVARGKGVIGKIGNKEITIGNRALMSENKIKYSGFENQIENFESLGKTVMILAENKKVIGVIAVADAVKEDSIEAVRRLNSLGYRTVMLTGDNENPLWIIVKKLSKPFFGYFSINNGFINQRNSGFKARDTERGRPFSLFFKCMWGMICFNKINSTVNYSLP